MSALWHCLWHRLFSGGQREYAGIYDKHYRDALRAAYGYASSMVLVYLSSAKRTMTDGQR